MPLFCFALDIFCRVRRIKHDMSQMSQLQSRDFTLMESEA